MSDATVATLSAKYSVSHVQRVSYETLLEKCAAFMKQESDVDDENDFLTWFDDVHKSARWEDEMTTYLRGHHQDSVHLLYFALEHSAPEAVSLAILAAWPDAVKEKGGRHGTSSKWQIYPEYDTDGVSPLYCALMSNAAEAVTLALLAAWPKAAKLRHNGDTMLHVALRNKASEVVLAALLAAFPASIKARGNVGDTPFQCALANNTPQATTLALLAAWPKVVKERIGQHHRSYSYEGGNPYSNEGDTTLHLALKSTAPDDVTYVRSL